MKNRTRARGVALQALYELDVTNHPIGTVLIERTADSELDDDLVLFFRSIVLGVWPIRQELVAKRSMRSNKLLVMQNQRGAPV